MNLEKKLIVVLLGFIGLSSFGSAEILTSNTPTVKGNSLIVKVRSDGRISSEPTWPGKPVLLPFDNMYHGEPGCYLACYTRKKSMGLYHAGNGYYTVGMIRVPGAYDARYCLPRHLSRTAIKNGHLPKSYQSLCANSFKKACGGANSCVVGPDTGGFFGRKLKQ